MVSYVKKIRDSIKNENFLVIQKKKNMKRKLEGLQKKKKLDFSTDLERFKTLKITNCSLLLLNKFSKKLRKQYKNVYVREKLI